jgi:hypothetical protein
MDRLDVRNACRDLDFWLEVNMKYLGCGIKKKHRSHSIHVRVSNTYYGLAIGTIWMDHGWHTEEILPHH